MSKVFEDEFMDLQAGLVSLCLELAGGKADKVFAYCSNEKKSKSFNAFFEVGGKIKTTDQLGVPGGLIDQFLRIGTGDVLKLDGIGEKYNRPVPTELKLYYDCASKKFNAEYKYEEVCSARTGKCAGQVFDEWENEMRNR